ncbi:MAG: glycosyltransferase family 2 protein, partial [candidate division WOR-3 bacterium]
MKFSLILCTYQRKFEVVDAFVESLLNNTYKNWELIVVDQNENDEILSGFEQKYKDFLRTGRIRVLRVPFKGLSRSRNFGLQYISSDADVIAFPDDDCEYPPELLEKISKLLENPKIDIVTGRSVDKKTKQDSNGRWSSKDTRINLYNVWTTTTSFTIFVRRKCLKIT